MTASDIADFLIEHSIHTDKSFTEDIVKRHMEYNTMFYIEDILGIVAVIRWNIDNGTAHILEAVVRPDKRTGKVLKDCIVYGLTLHPEITGLSWERKRKYPERSMKYFKINRSNNGYN